MVPSETGPTSSTTRYLFSSISTPNVATCLLFHLLGVIIHLFRHQEDLPFYTILLSLVLVGLLTAYTQLRIEGDTYQVVRPWLPNRILSSGPVSDLSLVIPKTKSGSHLSTFYRHGRRFFRGPENADWYATMAEAKSLEIMGVTLMGEAPKFKVFPHE